MAYYAVRTCNSCFNNHHKDDRTNNVFVKVYRSVVLYITVTRSFLPYRFIDLLLHCFARIYSYIVVAYTRVFVYLNEFLKRSCHNK